MLPQKYNLKMFNFIQYTCIPAAQIQIQILDMLNNKILQTTVKDYRAIHFLQKF
jgi:hypothetical protein